MTNGNVITQSTPVTIGILVMIVGSLCTSAFFTGALWQRVSTAERDAERHEVAIDKLTENTQILQEIAKLNQKRLDLLENK